MSKGQNRRVGQGMKPRGDGRPSAVDLDAVAEEQKAAAETDGTAPTTGGQPESIIQPIVDQQEGEPGGEHLEMDLVQNLESAKTAGVASSAPFEASEGAVQKAADRLFMHGQYNPPAQSLEEALKASAADPVIDAEFPEVDELAGKMAEHFLAEIGQQLEPGGVLVATPMRSDYGYGVRTIGENPRRVKIILLGEQQNGDFTTVITIREGYIEPVRQWAESDGKTLEEWLTDQLSGYLENWGSPAKGR